MTDQIVPRPSGPDATEPGPQRRTLAARIVGDVLPKSYLFIVLVVILAVGFIASPAFLTSRNALNVITFAAVTSVLAVGQFFVVASGGIDLSVGSTVALSTVISSLLLQHGNGGLIATVITLLACTAIGLVNGLLVVWLRIPSFIATLATLSVVQGLSYIIQSTSLISITDSGFLTFFADGKVLGVPSPVIIFVLITLVAAFVARFTVFGRSVYAIGGNRDAARLSGLPVGRELMFTYMVSGLLAGLAGLLAAAQLQQGSSLIGQGYELDAIAAVVVGGASLAGGRGDPISAVIGGLIIGIINNIMNLIGISSEPQLVIKGIVIVVAVFLSSADGVARISNGISGLFRRQPAPASSTTT